MRPRRSRGIPRPRSAISDSDAVEWAAFDVSAGASLAAARQQRAGSPGVEHRRDQHRFSDAGATGQPEHCRHWHRGGDFSPGRRPARPTEPARMISDRSCLVPRTRPACRRQAESLTVTAQIAPGFYRHFQRHAALSRDVQPGSFRAHESLQLQRHLGRHHSRRRSHGGTIAALLRYRHGHGRQSFALAVFLRTRATRSSILERSWPILQFVHNCPWRICSSRTQLPPTTRPARKGRCFI